MKSSRREFLAAFAATAAMPAWGRPMAAFACPGTWVGGFPIRAGYTGVDFVVRDEISGTINAFPLGLSNAPLAVNCSQAGLSFAFTGRGGAGSFSGRIGHETLTGSFNVSGVNQAATFVRSAPHLQEEYDRLLGAYRSSEGDVLMIGRVPFSPKIALTNLTTGALRTLYPAPEGGYFHGRSFAVPSPVDGRVTVGADGRLSLRGSGGRLTAAPIPARVEEVSITSDDGIVLVGTLRMPEGDGPFPTVVFAHGSGPADRHGFLSLQYFLPTFGIATLAYDKRGGGRSGGQYVHRFDRENFERLAKDLVAAIQFVKARPRIDASRVGLVGISQAGWTLPIAATLTPVAASVLISGPPVAFGLENDYSRLTGDGAGPGTLSQEEIERRIAATAPTGFDPQPYIRDMHMPALWLFGARDQSVPARLCVAAVEQLRAAGQPNLEVKLYETGNHALWETEHGTLPESPLVRRYVPGFFADLQHWLERHLIAVT